jgi:hypothetical protein
VTAYSDIVATRGGAREFHDQPPSKLPDLGRGSRTYLAGPMRGVELYNFPAFDLAAASLRARGYIVVNSAEHDRELGFDPECSLVGFDLEAAFQWDFESLLACDGIALLEGWEDSIGARVEQSVAVLTGKWALHQVLGGWSSDGSDMFWSSRPVPWRAARCRGAGAAEDTVDSWGARALALDKAIGEAVGGPVPKPRPYRVGEERITDPETGGQKGAKSAKLGAIDPLALKELAEVAGMGEEKYARFNFAKGYPWSLSADAAFRHLLAFLDGEDNDPESGLSHAAHFAWHGLCLTTFAKRGLGTDDRIGL